MQQFGDDGKQCTQFIRTGIQDYDRDRELLQVLPVSKLCFASSSTAIAMWRGTEGKSIKNAFNDDWPVM
jgi:hypothetical protein